MYLCTDCRQDLDFFFSGVGRTEKELIDAAERADSHIWEKRKNKRKRIKCRGCHSYLHDKRKKTFKK